MARAIKVKYETGGGVEYWPEPTEFPGLEVLGSCTHCGGVVVRYNQVEGDKAYCPYCDGYSEALRAVRDSLPVTPLVK